MESGSLSRAESGNSKLSNSRSSSEKESDKIISDVSATSALCNLASKISELDKIKNVFINLFAVSGKEIFVAKETVSGKFLSKKINLENLSDGVYYLQIISDVRVITEKIVIAK